MKHDLYTQENIDLVNEFNKDPGWQAMVESEIGKPVKVIVDWENDVIKWQGPISGRIQSLTEFIETIKNSQGLVQ